MHRSLIPFILVSLGFATIFVAATMPLFEWQISDVVTNFPPDYDLHIQSSPWTARLGDSLDHGLYLSFGNLYVSKDGRVCRHKYLNFVARRSWVDERLERISLNIYKSISWLYNWSWAGIVLSVAYILWFSSWYKYPIWKTVLFAFVFTGVFQFGLTQILRDLLPRVIPLESVGTLECYHGTVTFNAMLSKVHYETLLVFVAGILLELGAFGVVAYQMVKAVRQRKKAVNS